MTEGRLHAAVGRLEARLRSELARRVLWLTDARRDAFGDESAAMAIVVVLGREHYLERRKSYPVRSWRDLHRVLREELSGAPPTLTLIGPVIEDRREVTFFELLPGRLERAGRAVWLVPESVPLALTLPAQQVAVVRRDGLSYFLADSGVSQIAGGAVVTPALFAMAAGLDPDRAALELDRNQASARLWAGLRRLGLAAWLRLLTPAMSFDLGLAWRPLAPVAGAGLVGYLLLASGYLSFTETLRQRELAALGPEVDSLLRTQHEVERLSLEQGGLARVLRDRQPSYPVWRVAAQAWQHGASLEAVSLVDGSVTLRGTAAAATEILAALAADPGVSDARFGAPVRQLGGREEFVITLKLTGKGHDG
jgi:hypothetical protein